ncbi:unnamed protein product [Linum trigynum]|uniref:Uncharacterized protein n=1 Tax=Linum trigynum TaxID=586398 RepID=A0AAV2EAZ2_9ROSI
MAAISFSNFIVAAAITIALLQGWLAAAAGYPAVTCNGRKYGNLDVNYAAAVDQAMADMVENTVPGESHHAQFPKAEPVVFGRSGCARDCQTSLDIARGYLRLNCAYRVVAYVDMGDGTFMGYSDTDY